jgi:cell division septal protein FtsQ
MERETKIKIIGTGIFIILLLGVVYLVYYSNKIDKNENIESVKVIGNKLLSENDYLTFTRLSDLSGNNKFSLSVIKSRFEKHPYVLKADVKFINEKEVKVFLTEKRIYGVIIKGSEAMFAADGFEVLPVFQDTKMFDFPVLSNINENNLKPLRKLTCEDILQAFKIIDAARLINPKMLKDLSEINLRNSGDVVLTFSGLSIPVIFGRNSEAEKLVSLEALMNSNLVNANLLSESDYIDLRFYNDIYIGKTERVEL